MEKGKRGQGMVEFALVFPLLLFLVLGIIEFGRILFNYSAVVSASREAARYGAAIQDIGGGIPQYKDCEGIRDAAKRIGGSVGISDADITIQYSNTGGVYATACPPSQEVRLSDRIAVSVETTISPIVPMFRIPPIPIGSTSNRTILKEIVVGESGTGVGSISGAVTDVNFKTTSQTAEETRGTISVDLILNQVASDNVTVPFSLTGTAQEGVDYTITSSPVYIPAGSQTTTIYISLINDGISEGDETLYIGLDTPTNATKGPQNIHAVTIADPPQVSFSTVSQAVSEGVGTTAVMVELSKGSSQDITVPYSTGGDAQWGSSKDYTSSPNPVLIPSGSLSRMIVINVHDDDMDEYDESATFSLDTPTNALLGSPSIHTLNIADNDAPPDVSFYSPTISISEEVGAVTTSVYLSQASGKEIVLPYSLSGTTTADDYSAHNPSPITIPAGSKSATISFDVTEGDGYEEDETLVIDLGTPTNATLGTYSNQTITITEDTPVPEISFQKSSSSDQENGGSHVINVEMSNGYQEDVLVSFSHSGSASEGSTEDYTISSSPLLIPAGHVRGDILVEIVDDVIDEADETVQLTLDSVNYGTLGEQVTHTMTIQDNDAEPEVEFQGASQNVLEPDGAISVPIILDVPSSQTISVPLTYTGSAAATVDYDSPPSSIDIPPGTTSTTLSIDLVDDGVYDPSETIIINMGSPTNAVLGDQREHTISITDDELSPCTVKSSLLTVGTESITWTLNNAGEDIQFVGGSVKWPESSNNKPRLSKIYFAGAEVYSGNDKPGTMSYAANEAFSSGTDADLSVLFDDVLGKGEHKLTANFKNQNTGDTCSQTITYNKP